jgi:hypothetical protein
MHWRTPFPPKRLSVLAELMTVFRKSFDGEPAPALPDELPPACEIEPLTNDAPAPAQ